MRKYSIQYISDKGVGTAQIVGNNVEDAVSRFKYEMPMEDSRYEILMVKLLCCIENCEVFNG